MNVQADLVPTPDLHACDDSFSQTTWMKYAQIDPDFPKAIKLASVNFYKRSELLAYVKAKARKKRNKN
jgi:hypothetical protein